MNKNRLHHPEIAVEEYEGLPEILANPDHVVWDVKPHNGEAPRSVILLKRLGALLYRLAVKATLARSENFALSLTVIREKDWGKLLRKEIK
ncbi:hypothetical protein E3E12_07550 [Formicincola oecophyllae]|uniref:Uncharacterized protein n=1 Tax=Formicincola oecophyllae TaxID=2558361 RepID=A0A4Y6U9J0_9PROT|nr:hypothetical protein [Formicincola oecophyllae]QDH14052.2 hypothetical protein E3E12_07550 [Formicincola oecophyllae]